MLLRCFALYDITNDCKYTFDLINSNARVRSEHSFVGGACQFSPAKKKLCMHDIVVLFIVTGTVLVKL
jgi:hypothetical protein